MRAESGVSAWSVEPRAGDVTMPKAKITQTGPDSATVEPFVLRPGETTRLVFKPQLVNNKQDENKPVRGRASKVD